jgi:hypothetical protein
VDLIGCNGLVSCIGLNSHIRRNIPVSCIGLLGPIKLSIVGCNGFIGLIGPIRRIGFVGRIGHNGLVGIIGLNLFSLACIIGLIGFGLVSLIGLDDLSITSLFGLSASSALHLIIFFILVGLSIYRQFKQAALKKSSIDGKQYLDYL